MRKIVLIGMTFLLSTSFAKADERKVDFEKTGGQKGALTQRILTYKGVKPLTKICEGGCPTPLYRWTCNDNDSCGLNCAAKPPYAYCY
jgi:hypothetical protein